MATTDEKTKSASAARTTSLWLEDLWSDIARAFISEFGTRWTPEVQQRYQEAQQATLQAARLASGDALEAPPEPDLPRILTNFTRGRS